MSLSEAVWQLEVILEISSLEEIKTTAYDLILGRRGKLSDASSGLIVMAALKIKHDCRMPLLAARLLAAYIQDKGEEEFEILVALASALQDAKQIDAQRNGIQVAIKAISAAQDMVEQAFALFLVIRGQMITADDRDAIRRNINQMNLVLEQAIEEGMELPPRMVGCLSWEPYVKDVEDRILNRKVAQSALRYAHPYSVALKRDAKKLKIGFMSHCFRRHSVGYLMRWVKHIDRNKFDLYFYNLMGGPEDDIRAFYRKQGYFRDMWNDAETIAKQMLEDGIDILIDLDSVTLDVACQVMAMNPAAVSATYLGWDASGLADYYITDRQAISVERSYEYLEEIAILPTQVAVDGFEVGVPTVNRELLGIRKDEIVYMTIQRGFKLNPDVIDAQMEIIGGVEGSRLVIKGHGIEPGTHAFAMINQAAEKWCISPERVIVLGESATQEEHRANVAAIADIILDTYPYGGMTTTIEALWLEIPVVTWQGEQYASRCSASAILAAIHPMDIANKSNERFMPLIPSNRKEYIDYAVTLGDSPMYLQAYQRLLKNGKKALAPLWNTRAFAKNFEGILESIYFN